MSIVFGIERHWVSPWVFACFVTLREKKLAFDVRVVDSAKGETRAADYLAETVTGRVPTLVHDGFGLGESSAIVEYLDETFPEVPVLPRTPRERARCRQLMSWLRSDETLLAALEPFRPHRARVVLVIEHSFVRGRVNGGPKWRPPKVDAHRRMPWKY